MTDRNRCGGCSMCCKIVGVTELAKPPNKWCEFCAVGSGCRIYQDRPRSCAAFECFWFSNAWISDELRPDRCKVVFDRMQEANAVLAMVDPGRPDAWKAKPVERFIKDLVERFKIAVVVMHGPNQGRETVYVLPEGRTREDVIAGMKKHGAGVVSRYAEQEGLPADAAKRAFLKMKESTR